MTQHENEILDLYCMRCKELMNAKALQYHKVKLSIKYQATEDKGLVFAYDGPEKESLVCIVTVLRQLYSKSEPIYFYRICRMVRAILLSRHRPNHDNLEFIKGIRHQFGNILKASPIGIKVNAHKFTPIELIDLWCNGNIFHSDIEKVKKFEWLVSSALGPFADYVFISSVINLSITAINLAAFIDTQILAMKPVVD